MKRVGSFCPHCRKPMFKTKCQMAAEIFKEIGYTKEFSPLGSGNLNYSEMLAIHTFVMNAKERLSHADSH